MLFVPMESCSSATHCGRSFHRTSSRGFVFRTISQCWTEDARLDFVAHLFQFPALEGLWVCIVSFIQLSTFKMKKPTHSYVPSVTRVTKEYSATDHGLYVYLQKTVQNYLVCK